MPGFAYKDPEPERQLQGSPAGIICVMALAVFAACMAGIYTRPVGFLASIWPANAIMLGLLLRFPAAAHPAGWLAAAIAYMAADLIAGSEPGKAVILNSANLLSVGTAFAIYSRLPAGMARLEQPAAMMWLVVTVAAASVMAGLVGGFANPLLFGGDIATGWAFWFATEFANYIAILPVILSAPSTRLSAWTLVNRPAGKMDSLPAAALFLSCVVAVIVGGPGAIAFPVPALLWCSLIYTVFPATVLTLLFSLWAMVVFIGGYIADYAGDIDKATLISVRLGASLITLGPVTLAVVMKSHHELLAKLHHIATHDQLTGANSRHAFRKKARRILDARKKPVSILLIDLDHFKSVNDTYGHAGGDAVLIAFAERVRDCLEPGNPFGRIGGEEFAIALPGSSSQKAGQVAAMIREKISATPVTLGDGRSLTITASIGMSTTDDETSSDLDVLLAQADKALYRAKQNGRNRVEAASRSDTAIPA